jgi:hypothetical protein
LDQQVRQYFVELDRLTDAADNFPRRQVVVFGQTFNRQRNGFVGLAADEGGKVGGQFFDDEVGDALAVFEEKPAAAAESQLQARAVLAA